MKDLKMREGNELIRRRVLIDGRVQGVFFRAATSRQARQEGVTGWVRNLPDGRVEAEFQGSTDQVSACVEWCRRGPSAARVTAVEVIERPVEEAETEFSIRY